MPKIMLKGEEVEIDFYREEVKSTACTEDDCFKHPGYVSIDDATDAVCNPHRLEMSPGARRRFIKIEDVPFKNEPRSASEVAFNGEADGFSDEEYELEDIDAYQDSPTITGK